MEEKPWRGVDDRIGAARFGVLGLLRHCHGFCSSIRSWTPAGSFLKLDSSACPIAWGLWLIWQNPWRQGQDQVACLAKLTELLRASRLDVESTLCQESLSNAERNWLRENRSDEARYWHLLTDWKTDDLQYVGP